MPEGSKPATKPDDPAEYQRFLDMAKELGVDGSQSTDEVFDRLKPAIIYKPRPMKEIPIKRRPKE
jgi:hypothetical protein